VDGLEGWKRLVDEVRREWGLLWRDRIDDRVRAEGIADRNYSLLFVDRGDVIIATRDFKPLCFREILQQHKLPEVGVDRVVPPSPAVGGWGKFIRDVLRKQGRVTRRGRRELLMEKPDDKVDRQLKKGGRGWLHFRFRK